MYTKIEKGASMVIGRPKMKKQNRKISVSVSLTPSVALLLEKTENKSHFIDTSVQTSRAVAMAIQALREKRITLEEAMEQIEDAADIWTSEFEESEELVF